jgi:hypothetical protein
VLRSHVGCAGQVVRVHGGRRAQALACSSHVGCAGQVVRVHGGRRAQALACSSLKGNEKNPKRCQLALHIGAAIVALFSVRARRVGERSAASLIAGEPNCRHSFGD